MAAELIIASETGQDLAEAYAWYEGRRTGLGEEFLSSVDACIEAIRRTPEMHAVLHENYHRGLVRRFPYAIFYEYAADTVISYGGMPYNEAERSTRLFASRAVPELKQFKPKLEAAGELF